MVNEKTIDNEINKIHTGYFICLTNQSIYFNKGANIIKYKDLLTYNNYNYKSSKALDYEDIKKLPDKIEFKWDNINEKGNKIADKSNFAWLNPIKIIKI